MENVKAVNGLGMDSANEMAGRVQSVLQQVHEELRSLQQQRSDVIRRIGTVKRTIVGLAALLGDDALSTELRELSGGGGDGRKPGLTKACRSILMQAGQAMSARDVRDHLQETAPSILAGHKDPLASVTTILSRLVESGEAHITFLGNGRRAWQWAAEPAQAQSQAPSQPARSEQQTASV